MIWTQEVTLIRWTQPSGPLCLWQCLKSLTVELCFYSHLFEDVQGPNATADSHILIGIDDLMCLSLSTINCFVIFLLLRFRLFFRQAIKSLPRLLRLFSRKPLWWSTSSTFSQPSILKFIIFPWRSFHILSTLERQVTEQFLYNKTMDQDTWFNDYRSIGEAGYRFCLPWYFSCYFAFN